MRFLSGLPLLVLGGLPLASSQDSNVVPVVEARQLQTIGVSTSGKSSTTSAKSSSSSTSSSATSTSTSSSKSSSQITTTSKSTSTPTSTGYDMVITTIFTQPTDCVGGLTEVALATDQVWLNIINPVPTETLTSCYPSQFYSSAIATASLPAFSQLVCPYNWETYNINATYIICCPNGFGFYAPYYTNTERPGLDAVCTSSIWPNILMDITSYDATALATVIATSAGVNGSLVLATPFDGNKATAVVTSTSSSSSSTSRSSSTSPTTSTKVPSTTTSSSTKTSSSSTSSKSSTSTKVSSTTTSSSTKTSSSTTSSKSSTSKTSTTTSATLTAISQLPTCGQTCFSNMLAQYSALGCATANPSCLCRNANFGYGLIDCSNGACGTAVASTVIAFESAYCSSAIAASTTYPTTTTATATATISGISSLPTCGQTCFNNMLAEYATLGCAAADVVCMCSNVNFGYGVHDCATAACNTADASTVIAFESAYCASATATVTAAPTATGIASLPSCGQTCFNNMLAQYSALGCASADPACLCSNVNFGYGVRDCSNGACGTAVASTVIAFESAYCASATAAAATS
ncbi:CFEM protein [Coleophoma crateriformis]|uniref:CFEM protein n=1 Tax=Coleophoma crateriformis TaxID=565419 RepID=A0A3D8Q507_9HELO|nr:CFEM protein [Coleophoma crateriformis]